MIEGSEEVVVPEFDSKVREEPNPGVREESLRKDTSPPSTLAHRKPRWLT